jgi:hypothetical protein
MPGGGRPVKFKQLDDRIAAWVRERLDRQLPVSRRIIQIQAERMSCAEADGGDEKFFKGSSEKIEIIVLKKSDKIKRAVVGSRNSFPGTISNLETIRARRFIRSRWMV